MYDISNPDSLVEAGRWLKELRQHAPPSCVVMLVGNKLDLADRGERAVSVEEGLAVAEREDLAFMETSALTGDGVVPAFTSVVEGRVHSA